jgi:hypothetical protein
MKNLKELKRPVYRKLKDGSGLLKVLLDNSYIIISTQENLFAKVSITHIKDISICSERNNPERFKKASKKEFKTTIRNARKQISKLT